ncbi:hypothetical protein CHY08_23685 (plasmid) [Rhizobium leguminosarum bv. viciae]|nr:hypothetical protein CHY08_23685 [Rhizobium leguminosarum bv. viciae]
MGLEAWKEHKRVMDAIAERDGETAELLMRRHVRSATSGSGSAACKVSPSTRQRQKSIAGFKVP